jgi:hypothetical protein
MSIFGQVWLWSLVAFVIGGLLTWLVLVRPLHQRIHRLERRLATAQAEASHGAVELNDVTKTSYLTPPTLIEPAVQSYAEQRQRYAEDEAYPEQAVGELDLEAWMEGPVAERRPEPELKPERMEPAANEHVEHPEFETEPAPEPASLFQQKPQWFELDEVPERSPFEQPALPKQVEAPAIAEATSAYAFDSGHQGALPVAAESPIDSTQVLPKRPRRESPPGGFDPPRPIQPSMRAVERREPNSDLNGGYSGSLFEPSVQPGQYGLDGLPLAPELPVARSPAPVDSVPAGPFGPGSAMPRPGGGRPSAEFTVKASVTALRFCTEDSPQFARMIAEVWFRTPADAERVGFRVLT